MSTIDISNKASSSFPDIHNRFIRTAIIVLFVLYISLGIFPIVPLENDGMRISVGVEGINLYQDYSYTYNYASQAGVHQIVSISSRVLNLEPFYAFSLITFLSSIIFIFAASYFLCRLLDISFLRCFVVIILFQEVYVSGYYPNSSIMAAAFLSLAFLAITWNDRKGMVVLSALLFALAVWCRIDAVLMGLVMLGLLFKPDRHSIQELFSFVMSFLVAVMALYFASNISIQEFMQQFSGEVGSASDLSRALTIFSLVMSFAAIYFACIGFMLLYKFKSWRLLFLSVIAPLPLILAYGLALDSPKKLLYDIPLFAIPVLIGLQAAHKKNNKNMLIVLVIGLLLVVSQYIFSPAYEVMFSRATLVSTSDEERLRGAIAYTPIYYARHKRETFARDAVFKKKLDEYLQQYSSSYIISQDWMANQWLLYHLQNLGYRIKETENLASLLEDGQRLILSNGKSTVFLVRWRPETDLQLPVSLEYEIGKMPQVLYIGPDYTTTEYAQKSFLSKEFDWQILPHWGRFETILFTHK